jgi:hypothetical protein
VLSEKYFYGHENGMCSADYADDYRTLLYGFLGVFDLEDAALG